MNLILRDILFSLITVSSVISFLLVLYIGSSDYQIRLMVEKGTPPIEAACALGRSTDVLCALQITNPYAEKY